VVPAWSLLLPPLWLLLLLLLPPPLHASGIRRSLYRPFSASASL